MQGTSATLAPQVCIQCKARKKKCDKKMPCCALCKKRMLQCTYEPIRAPVKFKARPTSAGCKSGLNFNRISSNSPPLTLWGSSTGSGYGLSALEISTSLMAALSKSASDIGPSSLTPLSNTQSVDGIITMHVLEMITSNGESIPNIMSTYHASQGLWLSISQTNAWNTRAACLVQQPCARLATLLACIFLVTRLPDEQHKDSSMRTSTYFVTKALVSAIVSTGEASLDIVYSSLLMAVYETGHGFLGPAQMTMALTLRLGGILLNSRQQSLGEAEIIQDTDEGLLWWAIIVHERFMNLLGPREDIIVTESPISIPSDPIEWATMGQNLKMTDIGVRSSHSPALLGPFCRSAQASVMVRDVLLELSEPRDKHRDYEVMASLDRSLHELTFELLNNAKNGWEDACSAIALCISSIIALHHGRLSRPDADKTLQPYSIMAIRTATRMVIEIAYTFNRDMPLFSIPPLPIAAPFAIWQAGVCHIEHAGDDFGTPQWNNDMKALVDALRIICERWKIADRYVRDVDSMLDEAWTKHTEQSGQQRTSP